MKEYQIIPTKDLETLHSFASEFKTIFPYADVFSEDKLDFLIRIEKSYIIQTRLKGGIFLNRIDEPINFKEFTDLSNEQLRRIYQKAFLVNYKLLKENLPSEEFLKSILEYQKKVSLTYSPSLPQTFGDYYVGDVFLQNVYLKGKKDIFTRLKNVEPYFIDRVKNLFKINGFNNSIIEQNIFTNNKFSQINFDLIKFLTKNYGLRTTDDETSFKIFKPLRNTDGLTGHFTINKLSENNYQNLDGDSVYNNMLVTLSPDEKINDTAIIEKPVVQTRFTMYKNMLSRIVDYNKNIKNVIRVATYPDYRRTNNNENTDIHGKEEDYRNNYIKDQINESLYVTINNNAQGLLKPRMYFDKVEGNKTSPKLLMKENYKPSDFLIVDDNMVIQENIHVFPEYLLKGSTFNEFKDMDYTLKLQTRLITENKPSLYMKNKTGLSAAQQLNSTWSLYKKLNRKIIIKFDTQDEVVKG